jgi:hypothetical protein
VILNLKFEIPDQVGCRGLARPAGWPGPGSCGRGTAAASFPKFRRLAIPRRPGQPEAGPGPTQAWPAPPGPGGLGPMTPVTVPGRAESESDGRPHTGRWTTGPASELPTCTRPPGLGAADDCMHRLFFFILSPVGIDWSFEAAVRHLPDLRDVDTRSDVHLNTFQARCPRARRRHGAEGREKGAGRCKSRTTADRTASDHAPIPPPPLLPP